MQRGSELVVRNGMNAVASLATLDLPERCREQQQAAVRILAINEESLTPEARSHLLQAAHVQLRSLREALPSQKKELIDPILETIKALDPLKQAGRTPDAIAILSGIVRAEYRRGNRAVTEAHLLEQLAEHRCDQRESLTAIRTLCEQGMLRRRDEGNFLLRAGQNHKAVLASDSPRVTHEAMGRLQQYFAQPDRLMLAGARYFERGLVANAEDIETIVGAIIRGQSLEEIALHWKVSPHPRVISTAIATAFGTRTTAIRECATAFYRDKIYEALELDVRAVYLQHGRHSALPHTTFSDLFAERLAARSAKVPATLEDFEVALLNRVRGKLQELVGASPLPCLLPERAEDVLRLRCGGLSLREVGKELTISFERARQVLAPLQKASPLITAVLDAGPPHTGRPPLNRALLIAALEVVKADATRDPAGMYHEGKLLGEISLTTEEESLSGAFKAAFAGRVYARGPGLHPQSAQLENILQAAQWNKTEMSNFVMGIIDSHLRAIDRENPPRFDVHEIQKRLPETILKNISPREAGELLCQTVRYESRETLMLRYGLSLERYEAVVNLFRHEVAQQRTDRVKSVVDFLSSEWTEPWVPRRGVEVIRGRYLEGLPLAFYKERTRENRGLRSIDLPKLKQHLPALYVLTPSRPTTTLVGEDVLRRLNPHT